MPHTDERSYCTISEAAKQLDVSPSTVWRWIEAGRLPAYRAGERTIRINRADLDTFLKPAREWNEQRNLARVTAKEAHTDAETSQDDRAVRPLSDVEAEQIERFLDRSGDILQRIRQRHHGKPLSSSWDLIRRARDERSQSI